MEKSVCLLSIILVLFIVELLAGCGGGSGGGGGGSGDTIIFNKTYGRNDALDMQQTSDGGYIIAGDTDSDSYGAGGADAWLIKTDAEGNKLWDKTFGGNGSDANDVQQTNDGGYILAGYISHNDNVSGDAWLIKTDSNGNKVWDKTFGGNGFSSYANAVQQTSDGGYILAGIWSYNEVYFLFEWDAWLIKTDTDGNKVWDKTFGGNGYDSAHDVQQTNDGGYILAGLTESGSQYWLIKTDGNGNKVWDKTFGGYYEVRPATVQQTSDGGYIMAGVTVLGMGAHGYDYYALLVKTDADGNFPATPTP